MAARRGRVLLAEDNDDLRFAIEEALIAFGFDVESHVNGRSLLEAVLRSDPPFVILTDWMMPECSGADVLAELRRLDLIGFVPVVVLTADVTVRDAGHGAVVLEKPFDVLALGDVLDPHVNHANGFVEEARERLLRCRKSG